MPYIDFTTRYELHGHAPEGEYTMRIYCHSTPLPANFPVIEPVLLERGLLRIGMIGAATARLALAQDILHTALERLKADPFFLRRQQAPTPAPG